jgi:5-methylcytosine-specific restriction endonuclease McrA
MRVLSLNKSYLPIRLISKYDAIGKLYCNIAKAVIVESDGSYSELSFEELLKRSLTNNWADDQYFIEAVTQRVAVPRTIRLLSYDKIPRTSLRLSKRAVFNRDSHTCYICGKQFGENSLSVDHVIPVSRGGKTVWENLATCCKKCNEEKGNKLWSELSYKPKFKAYRPQPTSNMQKLKLNISTYFDEWKLFGL